MSVNTKIIETVSEFLAHAVALEEESAERYEMLADSMKVHHNDEVADLFRKLMAYSEKHAEEVHALAIGMTLPNIPPWEYSWNCPDSPEGGDCFSDAVDYLMTPNQALDLAIHNEARGRDFYAWVASESPEAEVRRLAGEMAEEEQEHVNLLQAIMLERKDISSEAPLEDLDPPNMPEG
jgi:rubrerythrin